MTLGFKQVQGNMSPQSLSTLNLLAWHRACSIKMYAQTCNAVPSHSERHAISHRRLAMAQRNKKMGQPKDAIAMLKADHQRVRDLFQQYEATSNAEAKRTIAEEVF